LNPAPITVEQASEIILRDVPPPRPATVRLEDAAGHVLAQDVASDVDFPPFDKSMMDGYAVRSGEPGPFEVVEEIAAGRVPSKEIRTGTCSKIMTGAPVPAGADAVQQVEKTRREGTKVTLLEPVKPRQNIAPRGQDVRAGDVVLRAGRRIGAAEIGALAAVGRVQVPVLAKPRVALIATGDELVPPDRAPGPGQIRNSNSFSLGAQVRSLGLACDDLGTVGDDRTAIRARIREGLSRDLLLLSGGVSAGDWDLVLPALADEGVEIRMHQARIKPGRPFCFAPRVFGLPGNPVSAFVIFEVFVRPYLGRMMGADLARRRVRARLEGAVTKRIDRVHYLPASVRHEEGEYRAELVPWTGSADLFALTRANGFVVVPIQAVHERGALVDCMLLGE
jgi:molybdopterin molybdotransferase